MFRSISNAPPETLMTSTWVATEACSIDISTNYTVRKNGQVNSPRPITGVAGDVFELLINSPRAGQTVFVPWTYNSVQSYFAIVSRLASGNRKLTRASRTKMWYEYTFAPNTHLASKSRQGAITSPLSTVSNQGPTQSEDLVSILDVQRTTPSPYAYFYSESNTNVVRDISEATKPYSITKMFNSATGEWESYILQDTGYIQKVTRDWTTTTSTNTVSADARCLFSDNVCLFVGGKNFLKIMSSINTVAETYTISDTIVYGVALANTIMVAGSSGNIYLFQNGTFQSVYKTTMVGAPVVFQSQIVFPIVSEYRLKIYDINGAFVKDFETPKGLPWALSEYRNTSITIAYADSKVVDHYTSLSGSGTLTSTTFNDNVTYAQKIGNNTVYAHHLLKDVQLTEEGSDVKGLNLVDLTVPPAVDVGSGEFTITTGDLDLPVRTAPGIRAIVNGIDNSTVVNDTNTMSLIARSTAGKKSLAVTLGSVAYDFRMYGNDNGSFSTYTNVASVPTISPATFTITVPPQVVSAPVALSHGTLFLNGTRYDGVTPVNAGDTLTAVVTLPQNGSDYYSMLSIADSQFALIVSDKTTAVADTQIAQKSLSTSTISSFTVSQAGTYLLPNYTNASIKKNGNLLTFPATLSQGDVLEINHQRMSLWWDDTRDTMLIGPTAVYDFKGVTRIDDIPNPSDAGSIHNAIPDFDSILEKEITIAGLSTGYRAVIVSQYMKFSVNGGEWQDTPYVVNGDKIRVLYTVQNMWEEKFVDVVRYNGTRYPFASVKVDPPLGVNFDNAHAAFNNVALWIRYKTDPALPALASGGTCVRLTAPLSMAPTSKLVQATTSNKTATSTPKFNRYSTESSTGAATSKFNRYSTESSTLAPFSNFNRYSTEFETRQADGLFQMTHSPATTDMSLGDYEQPGTLGDFPLVGTDSYLPMTLVKSRRVVWGEQPNESIIFFSPINLVEPSYGYPAEQVQVEKEAIHIPDTSGSVFIPNFLYGTPSPMRSKDPIWYRLPYSRDLLVMSRTVWWEKTYYTTNMTATFDSSAHDYNFRFGSVKAEPLLYLPVVTEPRLAKYGTYDSLAATGQFVSYKHVRELNPKGGFDTEQAAEQAARKVWGNIPLQIYQQPEGTFSYVINRDTGIVCDIIPTLLTSRSWLIGGG